MITKKSHKFGTYATTEYYLNNEFLGKLSEHQNNCGTDWFNNLPDEDEAEFIEIGVNDLPNSIYELYKEKTNESN